ncbi:Uncharacterised protein [Vibrio cholerae]|nr:Uncharacterised protein [Vibrio cholerae]
MLKKQKQVKLVSPFVLHVMVLTVKVTQPLVHQT